MDRRIADQYLMLEKTSAEDPEGKGRTYTSPYSVGSVQEITTLTHHREREGS